MACIGGVKLLEDAVKIVEKVLRKIVAIDDMQFGFKSGKGTIDAVFILRRIQEEYLAKQKKLYMCLVDLERAFDRVPRKVVEWAMIKKGISEALATAVMSLHKGAKTKVKVGTHLSEELKVNVHQHVQIYICDKCTNIHVYYTIYKCICKVHHGSVLSPLLFAIVIDFATNEIIEGTLQEILNVDDLVLIAETTVELYAGTVRWNCTVELYGGTVRWNCTVELHRQFYIWKSAHDSKGLKVNLVKTRVMVSKIGQINIKPLSKTDRCRTCGRKTMQTVQYYVNLVETGYVKVVQRSKG